MLLFYKNDTIFGFKSQEVAEAIFQAIAVMNIIVFAFGNWGFNILIKAFKGPLETDWNRSIVINNINSIL